MGTLFRRAHMSPQPYLSLPGDFVRDEMKKLEK
jgi:hypothetical protein